MMDVMLPAVAAVILDVQHASKTPREQVNIVSSQHLGDFVPFVYGCSAVA
jgi:hypothetical protein